MKRIFPLWVLSLVLLACQPPQSEQASSPLPNIVVILADDMGSGDIQALNPNSQVPTPNLNQLVADGMHFSNAHSGSSVCTPTRYGLLTGRYAWRTRLESGVLSGYSGPLIEPERSTLASLLKGKGYHTAVIGKWHLGLDYPWTAGTPPEDVDNLNYCAEAGEIDYSQEVKNGPNGLGFDYSFLVPGSLDMSPYVYVENGRATALPDSISPQTPFPAFQRRGEISPDFMHQDCLDHLTEKATTHIAEQAQKAEPFFLYFPLTGPHKPALVAERFEGKSGRGPYGDLVMQVDWTVGEVIKALEAAGVADNTLILYTSDNGSYMHRLEDGATGHVSDAAIQGFQASSHQPNANWRGTKADIWEAGHRVPFMVRWPGKIAAGSKESRSICLTDVLATVAEIQESPLPAGQGGDSFSFLSLLEGKDGHEREAVVHHSVGGMFSLRQGKWKMVFGNGSGGRQQPRGKAFEKPYQLFDLENDPQETTDLLEAEPAIAQQMTEELARIREANR